MTNWTNRELYDALHQEATEQQRQAFDLLYRELYAVCFFMLQTATVAEPRELAQDCAQEAIVKIWKNLARCEQPDSLRNWAKMIARNQTLNELARQKRLREASIEREVDETLIDAYTMPAAALTRAEKYTAILDLLAAAPISLRSRYVIAAKYLLQMSEEEICQGLQEREGAELKPSHVQVTRAKNFKKIYSNADFLRRFWELQQTSTP
jgi:RNA polymerase sigma factor (sigma-70 family)